MYIDTTKDYWFLLESHTYVNFENNNRMLLYNTESGSYIESKEDCAIALIKSVCEKPNLGVNLLSQEMLADKKLEDFVANTINFKIGNIFPQLTSEKPISLRPILNLQKDVEKLKQNPDRSVGENVLAYLSVLNIYINGQCDQNCTYCNTYYKQVICCTKQPETEEIAIELITNLITQVSHTTISSINIIGGNLLKYSKLTELVQLLSNSKLPIHYWIHYKNLITGADAMLMQQPANKNIIINFPISEEQFKIVMRNVDTRTTLYFIIETHNQYEFVESILNNNINIKYKIVPFYNGVNLDFFEKNIFLTKDDIFSKTISQREIFCNQSLNSLFFGTLSIFPDGTAKAGLNTKTIGNSYHTTISELLTQEMETNTAWRKTRQNNPCKNCLYQYLCPPPSTYETVIGKPNLCHVKP